MAVGATRRRRGVQRKQYQQSTMDRPEEVPQPGWGCVLERQQEQESAPK